MDKPRYRAYLCCGPNCGPKGASALIDFLDQEIERCELEGQVSVAATGCQAHCESGPTMVVFPGPTFYQGIDRERLVRIVSQHFIGGEPVKEYFWNGVRRRIVPGQPPKTLQDRRQTTDDRPPQASPVVRGHQNDRLFGVTDRPEKVKPKRPPREVDDFKW